MMRKSIVCIGLCWHIFGAAVTAAAAVNVDDTNGDAIYSNSNNNRESVLDSSPYWNRFLHEGMDVSSEHEALPTMVVHPRGLQNNNNKNNNKKKQAEQSDSQDENNHNCPAYPKNKRILFNLTQDFMMAAYRSMELVNLTQRSYVGPLKGAIRDIQKQDPYYFEYVQGFQGKIDSAIVAKYNTTTRDSDQICYVVIGGGMNLLEEFADELWWLGDQWQNLNPLTTQIHDTDCVVRKGQLSIYNVTRYQDELRQSIHECVATCQKPKAKKKRNNKNKKKNNNQNNRQNNNNEKDDSEDEASTNDECPIVVSGLSQGAGAAPIAGLDLQLVFQNVTVITFGVPRVWVEKKPCNDLQHTRHFHFLTTTAEAYDGVALGDPNIFKSRHLGWPLFLDDEDNWPIATVGLNNTQQRTPGDRAIHERTFYAARMDELMSRNCFPIPVTEGWPNRHYCHYNDECMSGRCRGNEGDAGICLKRN